MTQIQSYSRLSPPPFPPAISFILLTPTALVALPLKSLGGIFHLSVDRQRYFWTNLFSSASFSVFPSYSVSWLLLLPLRNFIASFYHLQRYPQSLESKGCVGSNQHYDWYHLCYHLTILPLQLKRGLKILHFQILQQPQKLKISHHSINCW